MKAMADSLELPAVPGARRPTPNQSLTSIDRSLDRTFERSLDRGNNTSLDRSLLDHSLEGAPLNPALTPLGQARGSLAQSIDRSTLDAANRSLESAQASGEEPGTAGRER